MKHHVGVNICIHYEKQMQGSKYTEVYLPSMVQHLDDSQPV